MSVQFPTQMTLGSVPARESRPAGTPSVAAPGGGGQITPTDGKVLPQQAANAAPRQEVDLSPMVKQLNTHAQSLQRNVEFSVDKDSGMTVVKVVDTNTKELIRQIPSEEVLTLMQHFMEMEGSIIKTQV